MTSPAALHIATPPPAIAPAALFTAPAVAHVLSPSQVNEWLDCPARWFFHHALGLPSARTAALAIGEAIHHTTAACLRIWQRGQEFTHAQAAEQLAAQLDIALAGVPDLEPGEGDHLHTTAGRMLAAWLQTVAPTLRGQCAAVELHMRGRINRVNVQGAADVLTASGCVIDLKTASKKPAGVSQAHRFQLTTYAMLAEQHYGRPHTEARLITITKTASPAAVPQSIEITAADRHYAVWAYTAAHEAMQSGAGVIPRRTSLLCSRTNCAYWRECEEEFGGCVRD